MIQTKVLATLFACLAAGVCGILILMQYSFARNTQALALEAVTGSQKLFSILEAREISKMTAVSDALLMDTQVRDALAAKDRGRLLELTAPLYTKLKSEGITNWMFHTPAPNMAVLLRLHNPAQFGDKLNRYVDKEVVRTDALVSGNELARAGFAERIIRPVPDAKGGIAGYVEFGEELGQFIHAMKTQTGNDYGLLLSKKFLDRKLWADSSGIWKRRDNWNDNANFVVADKTTASENILRFSGDLSAVPAQGLVLDRYKDGDSYFVRGIFPIHDAAGNTAGAMFVVHDITAVYTAMRQTEKILLLVILVCLLIGTTLVLLLLNKLVFKRLKHIIRIAGRVVGGDFETEIKVSAMDEVGQLEELFEQFRQVFVSTLEQVTGMEEKSERESSHITSAAAD